jgi:hypothetical protein
MGLECVVLIESVREFWSGIVQCCITGKCRVIGKCEVGGNAVVEVSQKAALGALKVAQEGALVAARGMVSGE